MQTKLEAARVDYEDIIKSNLRVYGHEQGQKILEKMGDDLRAALIKNETKTISELPSYGGLAFRGCLRFPNKKEIHGRRNRTDAEKCLEEIRKAKAVEITESAHTAWQSLREKDKEAAWISILLIATEHIKPDPKTEQTERENHEE